MIIFLCNSDVGKGNTIGARLGHILKKVSSYKAFVRKDYTQNSNVTYVRGLDYLMKFLSAVPLITFDKIDLNKLKWYIFDHLALCYLKKQKNVAVIHSWDPLPRAFAYAKKRFGAKIILDVPIALPSIFDSLPEYFVQGRSNKISSYYHRSHEYVDTYIVPSQFVADSLGKVNFQNYVVIPFGVDSSLYVSQKKQKFFSYCFAGSINKRKGVPDLLEAWSLLGDESELHLYGMVYPEMKNILRKYDSPKLFVHGFMDIKNVLGKHHVFVFPTLMEGSAKVVYEALACNLPVITTYNAGSIVQDNVNGYIVPIADPAKLKDAMLKSRKNINHLSKNCVFVKEYSWDRYATRVIGEYR